MKYKIGDKVRYIKKLNRTSKGNYGLKIGDCGVIYSIDPDWIFPYNIDFGLGHNLLFKDEEICRVNDNNILFDKLFKNI